MCANHQKSFVNYRFFIRYVEAIRRFVFINYADVLDWQDLHGKAIALDISDRHAPFPPLFIIHEVRVRGHNFFQPISLEISDNTPWQDWILNEEVYDNTTNHFKRLPPPQTSNSDLSSHIHPRNQTQTDTGGSTSHRTIAPMNEDMIAEILAATRQLPTWKACIIEGTDWGGTAEENIQRYISSIGVETSHTDDAASA